jgi:hypothetical protein
MKNVTISMDEELYRATRLDAARAGKSMSRYIADTLREGGPAEAPAVPTSSRAAQLEALERLLSGPKWDLLKEGSLPTATERNER